MFKLYKTNPWSGEIDIIFVVTGVSEVCFQKHTRKGWYNDTYLKHPEPVCIAECRSKNSPRKPKTRKHFNFCIIEPPPVFDKVIRKCLH